jgi:phosphotransferase system HPr (HPr) family protein
VSMAEATVTVRNPSGLHARPAATFVTEAAGFAADLTVTNLTRDPERAANAKSILGVLGIGAVRGHAIRITADGADAEQALQALTQLVESGLGETIIEGDTP